MKDRRLRCLAFALLLAGVAATGVLLLRLSRPDSTQRGRYLGCMESDPGSWMFFTETGPAEPVFGFGGYLDGIPAQGSGPVAAERVMEADEHRQFLQLSCYDQGLQVFLDDALLYTDFPQLENRADAFLSDADPEGIAYDGLRLPLPENAAGKKLRIVTYGRSFDGLRQAVLPTLVSRFSDAAVETTAMVQTVAVMTARLLLGLFLLLILGIGAREENLWRKLLPLSGYFLLGAVSGICCTNLETFTGLRSDSGMLNWIYRSYIDLLYLYLAMELDGWKRWSLLGAALAHGLLCGLGSFGLLRLSETLGDWLCFGVLLGALVLMCFSKEKTSRRISLLLFALMGALAALWGITRRTGPGALYPLTNPVTALVSGYPKRGYTLLCGTLGVICTVRVIAGFARGMLLRQRQMQAMKSSAQAVQEKFEQAQATLRQTAAFRHDLKNHVAALELLARKQDTAEIQNYLNRLDGALEQLSPQVFTANTTVNTILQRFAAQAKEAGVTFRVNAMLPERLSIPDEDLCAFLFNLLDNALEAAAQTEPGEIFCSLQIRQQYLAIRCENTYWGPLRTDSGGGLLTTKDSPNDHGFGLIKMRAVAEKYGSVLDITHADGRFTVLTALKI